MPDNKWKILKRLKGHVWDIRSVAFNHDNTKIVSGSVDNTIKIWDVIILMLLWIFGMDSYLIFVLFKILVSRVMVIESKSMVP